MEKNGQQDQNVADIVTSMNLGVKSQNANIRTFLVYAAAQTEK